METTSYVALLRGINVGGKNKLPMRDLIAVFADAGCHNVQTYIQSGNVLFHAEGRTAETLPAMLPARMLERFGFVVPVVLRTAAQMSEVLQSNPFLERGVAESLLHVYFLADEPAANRVQQLDPERFAPDAFIVRGREIYLHLPDGMARTKLTNAYFDRALATTSTARNWRTVTTLCELLQRHQNDAQAG